MIDNLNLTELLANANVNENQSKTRVKKINPRLDKYDEEAKRNIKYSKLSILEEDDDIQKEEYKYILKLVKMTQIMKWMMRKLKKRRNEPEKLLTK
jgi:hypothetical protein